MLIGFLLVITTNSFYFALQELKDSRGSQNYIQAYSASEWALELALYELKKHGFWIHSENKSDKSVYSGSIMKPESSYSILSKTSLYEASIDPYSSKVLPLFWRDEDGNMQNISELTLSGPDMIKWNIIGKQSGTSGKWAFGPSSRIKVKEIDRSGSTLGFVLKDFSIRDFFSAESGNESYLILYNASSSSSEVELRAKNSEHFSLPEGVIISSSKVWNYKQNIKTDIDNTTFLGTLKYAVISD